MSTHGVQPSAETLVVCNEKAHTACNTATVQNARSVVDDSLSC